MKLHKMVRGAVGMVNPNITGLYYRSVGYEVDDAFCQVPVYDAPVEVQLQVQSLTFKDIQQVDNISQQGSMKAVYMNGNVKGIDRHDVRGGDKLVFYGRTWLVTQQLEGWNNSGWCKLALTEQMDEAQTNQPDAR